jgi:hypothetical protein
MRLQLSRLRSVLDQQNSIRHTVNQGMIATLLLVHLWTVRETKFNQPLNQLLTRRLRNLQRKEQLQQMASIHHMVNQDTIVMWLLERHCQRTNWYN